MTTSVGSPLQLAAAVVGVAVIVGILLWLLFRRGSIADRARSDVPEPDEPASGDEVLGE
jgi:hypothetical protein